MIRKILWNSPKLRKELTNSLTKQFELILCCPSSKFSDILCQYSSNVAEWQLINLLWWLETSQGPIKAISTTNFQSDLHPDCLLAISLILLAL